MAKKHSILKPSDRKRFEAWLDQKGADVLAPSNEWEVVRFKDGNGTHIVYRNKNDRLRFTGDSHAAWQSFCNGGSWSPAKRGKRNSSSTKKRHIVDLLIQRDGINCFYCHYALGDDITIEHIVPISHGGKDTIKNNALAHTDCNRLAGNLSVVEKIKLREQNLLEVLQVEGQSK